MRTEVMKALFALSLVCSCDCQSGLTAFALLCVDWSGIVRCQVLSAHRMLFLQNRGSLGL